MFVNINNNFHVQGYCDFQADYSLIRSLIVSHVIYN